MWTHPRAQERAVSTYLRCSYFHTPSSCPSGGSRILSMFEQSDRSLIQTHSFRRQNLFPSAHHYFPYIYLSFTLLCSLKINRILRGIKAKGVHKEWWQSQKNLFVRATALEYYHHQASLSPIKQHSSGIILCLKSDSLTCRFWRTQCVKVSYSWSLVWQHNLWKYNCDTRDKRIL